MDSPADRLRKARIDRGYKSARAAAFRFGWKEATYTSHENGTRPLTRAFRKYAIAFRVDEAWLRGLSGEKNSGVRGVPVTGEAAVGVWREVVLGGGGKGSEKTVDIPLQNDHLEDVRFAVHVADSSVNMSLPLGSYAICTPISDRARGAQNFSIGDILYIERVRQGLKEVLKEVSLRRVSFVNGERMRLSTHSTDAKLKQEITHPPAASSEKIRLIGRVIGTYIDYIPE